MIDRNRLKAELTLKLLNLVDKFPEARRYVSGWRVEFNDFRGSNRILGRCDYSRKLISLNARIEDMELLMDTFFHEAAHCLAPSDGHGSTWKRWCVLLGATPSRKANSPSEETFTRTAAKWSIVLKQDDGSLKELTQKTRRPSKIGQKYLSNDRSTLGKLYYIDSSILNDDKLKLETKITYLQQ